ncbi:unnamed protein product [Spirodela intermedia]|uniref:Leucine-rich repeat-containing protein 51 n=1 Tax=Spirodela intermedia TaxID=51605 RepID=A0A7I8IRL7_SPIIN|nr:unnamed protein product [Spirodela intermedia]CAA6660206.1 unnamed protein product [Spirodela intermedia]
MTQEEGGEGTTGVEGPAVPAFSVCQRVHVLGDPRRTGTVRYVGPVDGYDGSWIGVDWDDGGGKHDGVVNGVRYFSAKGQMTGSLVRPRNLSAGITLMGPCVSDTEVNLPRRRRVSFRNLKELDLTGNLLSSWQDVGSICEALPALEILNLTNNFLERDTITLEQLHLNKNKLKDNDHDGHECSTPFENLRCLLLGCNEIEDLASIDSLNLFPNLMDIRLSGNPVADPARGGLPRFILIARLSKVQMLNGSEVTSRERRESEIRYVRLVMVKLQSDGPEEIKRVHPRFAELKIHHGIEDEKPSTQNAATQSMASELISLTLKCVGASMGEKPPMTRKLPPPQRYVGKLKVLCESFFKLKFIKLRLFLQEEGSPLPLLLDDDSATLMDFGIGTGTTILVDEEMS